MLSRRLMGAVNLNSKLPVGDLPGWTQVYTEDFETSYPLGSFTVNPSGGNSGEIESTATPYARYGDKIKFYPDGYDDTYHSTKAYVSKTVSTHNNAPNSRGVLDIWLHTENVAGTPTPMASWQRPLLPSGSVTQLYGRYAYRMRSDSAAGYGAVALLITDPWPDNGEQDWPEGDLAGGVHGFYHYANASGGQQSVAPAGSPQWQDWHTYVMEWEPGRVRWYIDSTKVLDTTNQVGAQPYKFVIQSGGSSGTAPSFAVSGHLQIDWIAIWEYQP